MPARSALNCMCAHMYILEIENVKLTEKNEIIPGNGEIKSIQSCGYLISLYCCLVYDEMQHIFLTQHIQFKIQTGVHLFKIFSNLRILQIKNL